MSGLMQTSSIVSSMQYIFFLDWDDTLMPTTYLLSNIQEVVDSKGKHKTYNAKPQNKTEFLYNLNIVCNSTLDLLNTLLLHFKSSNIKIVTNSTKGWVLEVLTIAAPLCKNYAKIIDIIVQNKIEIMYARSRCLDQSYWKIRCFDSILSHCSLQKRYMVTTIGDQWSDHDSVQQSLSFHKFKNNIIHHQIKLLGNPKCRDLCGELKCTKHIINPQILSKLHEKGMVLQFDAQY